MAFDTALIHLTGKIQPADADVRFTADGKEILSFRMVVGRNKWNPETSKYDIPESDWFKVSGFGKRHTWLADQAVKGATVYVAGRFKTEEWTTSGGETRTQLVVDADAISVLAPPRQYSESTSTYTPKKIPESQAVADDLEDLPF
jgi:single-stranded DNA-binding protein